LRPHASLGIERDSFESGGGGFEPSVRLRVQRFSRLFRSAHESSRRAKWQRQGNVRGNESEKRSGPRFSRDRIASGRGNRSVLDGATATRPSSCWRASGRNIAFTRCCREKIRRCGFRQPRRCAGPSHRAPPSRRGLRRPTDWRFPPLGRATRIYPTASRDCGILGTRRPRLRPSPVAA
jgi:hypothetical protein